MISEEFGIVFPDKADPSSKEYYWGVIPPFEVDIPFEIEGIKFAIEYDGEYWHEDDKEKDKIKEQLLEEAGYYFFRISSDDHNCRFAESVKPLVKIIIQAIKQIIKKSK